MKTITINGKTYKVCPADSKGNILLKRVRIPRLEYKKEECIVFINGTKEELIKKCTENKYRPLCFCEDYVNNHNGDVYHGNGCVFGVKKK
jgi:hypothetical protein